MKKPSTNPEFDDILDELSNGALPAEKHVLLNRSLLDPQLRQRYLDRMELEGSLLSCYANLASEVTSSGLTSKESFGAAALSEEIIGSVNERRSVNRWKLLALAACLVAILASVSPDPRDSSETASTEHGESYIHQTKVATVTATRNCRWKGRNVGVGFGADLFVGDEIELLSGLAEISLERGGSIILEGPAKLRLRESGDLFLAEGHLSASIPTEARGVFVRTLRFGVRDTGAEFGIVAQSGGRGEVHVFKGNVFADLFNEGGSTVDTLDLSSEEAARLSSGDHALSRFRANHDRFVRSLSPVAGPREGLHLCEQFDYPAGPLVWQNGGFGWAGPWEDLETIEVDLPGVPLTNRVGAANLKIDGMISSGGRATQRGRRNRIRRVLSTSIGGVFEAAGLVENRDGELLVGRDNIQLYISFLQRVSRIDDGFYGVELNRGDGNRNRVLCIGNGAAGAGYGATSEYNRYLKDNSPPLGTENTDVNFFVIRIDYGSEDKDVALVYRNPESLSEENGCKVDATLEGFFSFDRISLGNFDGEKIHEVDEIRIGTTFRSVTGHRDGVPQNIARQLTSVAHLPSDDSRLGMNQSAVLHFSHCGLTISHDSRCISPLVRTSSFTGRKSFPLLLTSSF